MKVSLLFKEGTMNWKQRNKDVNYFEDFKCKVLLDAMAEGDGFIYDCAEKVIMCNLTSKEQILYRQSVLKDCIRNQEVILKIYEMISGVMKDIVHNKKYILLNDYPSVVLSDSKKKLQDYIDRYMLIGKLLEENENSFYSEGFAIFIQEFKEKITPEFLRKMKEAMEFLEKTENISVNASLGMAYQGSDFKRNKPSAGSGVGFKSSHSVCKISIKNWDARRTEYLLELKQSGLEATADILACVVNELTVFFTELHKEIAFYCGCIHLHRKLFGIGCGVTYPKAYDMEEHRLNFSNLYDVGLSLSQGKPAVGNTLELDNCELVIITGANQGGKSTFLRSVGLAQMMFQCGMFVCAERYEASVCNGICTHFRKNEDPTLNSGKLDDELRRFRNSIDALQSHTILMCNESFSSTNEKEGTGIALPILDAMLDSNIRVFFVTHFYSIPLHYENSGRDGVKILQGERKEDGSRSFKMVERTLNENSYGMDIYHHLFPVK